MGGLIGYRDRSHFYAEWVPFSSEEQRREAYSYLILWIKFTYRKVANTEIPLDFVDYEFIVRPNVYEHPVTGIGVSTVAVKFWVKKEECDEDI